MKKDRKESILEAVSLRLDGMTLHEVAEKMQVSYQTVYTWLATIAKSESKRKAIAACPFPAISTAICASGVTYLELYAVIQPDGVGKKHNVKISYVRRRITGQTPFSVQEWKRLSRYFSIPLEELMREKGEDREAFSQDF